MEKKASIAEKKVKLATCFSIWNRNIYNNGRHGGGSRLHSSRAETSCPAKFYITEFLNLGITI